MVLNLVNTALLPQAQGKIFDVHDKASAKVIGQVADMSLSDIESAVQKAKSAFPQWAAKTAAERADLLHAWYALVMQNRDDLARILSAESGKPLKEALGEIDYGAAFIKWFAEEAHRVYGDTIPAHKNGAAIIVTKQPVGIVAALTPWNFPNAMITRKIAPALAAGCTVVLRPSGLTPLSAVALFTLAQQAGMPDGVMNLVTTAKASEAGKYLATHRDVHKLSFTGSTEVGRILMEQAAPTLKKLSMELGGNAPFIVFESADIDAAVEGAIKAKFRNAGQTCVCVNRFYIHESVYNDFAVRFEKAMQGLKIAPWWEENADIGPLINADGVAKVEEHIKDAVDKGATLKLGGQRHAMGGNFFTPTLLLDMQDGMKIAQEETFGPVAALFPFKTEAEAIAKANDTEFGLASYIYTNDMAQSFRVSQSLQYGMVAVNDGLLSTPVAPFGGVKQSGFGREGSKYGIEEYVNIKYTLFNNIGGKA